MKKDATVLKKLLPDSRLRLERRPKWLNEPVPAREIMAMIAGSHFTGRDLVELIDKLIALVVSKSANAHDSNPFTEHNFFDRPRCRVCQCSVYECSGCVEIIGQPCDWSEEDRTVCTACVKPKGGKP